MPKGWNYAYDDNSYNYGQGWFAGYSGKDQLANWFRNLLKQRGIKSDYIDQMTDSQLTSILDEYFKQDDMLFGGLGNKSYTFQTEDALKDLQALQFNNYPSRPDYDQIYQDALNQINTENADIEAMYDDLLAQQNANFGQQMSDLNKSYNTATNQLLSNDYIKNRQLMDTATSELSRSRRNALEAGASAGLRLANNVNTMLSVQNKQAQTSLETSNNLAQMMLNQQQAARGIRGDYYNNLSQDVANRASLRRGSAERGANYANTQLGLQDSLYNSKRDAWDETYNAKYSDNAFGDSYRNYSVGKRNSYYGG